MRKMSYLVFLLILFFSCTLNTYAKSIVVITGTDVRIRDNSTTKSNVLYTSDMYDEFDLIDLNSNSAGNGCTKDWYKVNYEGKTGYVCSEFVKVEEVEETTSEETPPTEPIPSEEDKYETYKDYLLAIGFPESYIPYLESLHKKRPTWKFKVMNVNLDFNTVVSKEHTSSGRSLIEDYDRTIDGYKSLESWSYNYLTDVFYTGFSGGGSRWYAASTNTIAYYMDPRNFLTEKKVFMFESQYYNEALHTKEGITKMLKGTFMEGKYANSDKTKTYVDAFYDGAVKYNVSPYVLVSRAIQEVGASGSTIVSGTVKGYTGYYNFYNIGAYGTTASSTIQNGLKRAKEEGWNSQYNAIVGGAKFIGGDYLSVGQDTLYLNKWDLIGPTYYTHQYMQNIEAPSSEATKTYNAYKNMSSLDNAFMFSIPVFKNMPEKTSLPNKGNPNNYLSSLSVNGAYLFSTAGTETNYSLNLSTSTTSIDIAASKVSNKSTVNGVGSVSLNEEEETIPITVTAENGNIRTYNIKVTRKSTIPLAISEILNVADIKNDGMYISGINVGTDITEIVSKIKKTEPNAIVAAKDITGKDKISGLIASGDIIKITSGENEKELTIVIYGDINSDGKITSADYIKVKNHIMETSKLNVLEAIFADANKDGIISSADYVAIKNHIMETKLIIQ